MKVNEILDSSLHTILCSSCKLRKHNNQQNDLPSPKTRKSVFSPLGIFEELGLDLAVIPYDINGAESGVS